MSRNPEIDRIRTEAKRKRILEESFRLFSEKGIGNVSMLQITRAASVGDVTIYAYFGNKPTLAIAVSAYIWNQVWQDSLEESGHDPTDQSAYDFIRSYTEKILQLYHERPDILRFSSDYKNYLRQEGIQADGIQAQEAALSPMVNTFHQLYENAKTDRSIRTDIPEKEMFTTVIHTMLSMAERYAIGLVWESNHTDDHTRELTHLQSMLLQWCKG